MDYSMENAEVVRDFRTRWRFNYKQLFTFPADIEYEAEKAPDAQLRCDVNLEISGFEANKVTLLAEDDELDGKIYHLGFDPKFQQYSFDQERGSLIIQDTSKKLGKYCCVITPVWTVSKSY